MATHSNGETIEASHINEKFDTANVDTDTSLAANSDSKVASQKATKSYVDTKDSANVKTSGDQTINGVKTFGSIPVLPASNPTTNNQAVRKAYVDGKDSANVKTSGDQTINGVKTFGSIPVLPASNPTTDNQAVRKAYVDGKFALAAGDILIKSADTERGEGQYNTTYVKVKEFVIGRNYGTLRIKFDLAAGSSDGTGMGRIYRNGNAVGTEQSQSGNTYVTKSEDIAGWVTGDLCQLYCKTNRNDRYWLAKNFRIYASVGETISVTMD